MKKDPWRIVVFLAALGWILYTWAEKDLLSVYGNLPAEQILPLILTTAAVSLVKVAGLAGMILLVKWMIGKFKK